MSATITITAGFSGTETITNEAFSLQLSTTLAGMEQKYKRTILATTTVQTVLLFGAAAAAGQLVDTNGVLFINRDSTNFITLGFIVSGAKAFYVKLPPERCFFLWTKDLDTNTSGGAFSAFSNITSVTADADTGTCMLDILALD